MPTIWTPEQRRLLKQALYGIERRLYLLQNGGPGELDKFIRENPLPDISFAWEKTNKTSKNMGVNIIDIKDMPGYNPAVKNGIDSVSTGKVTWTCANKATCSRHGAMLCVSPDRRIWRCPECHAGCYVVEGNGLEKEGSP